MPQRFNSETDTWLVVLGIGAAAISVVAVMPILITNANVVIKIITAGVLILTVILVSWVYLGTFYVVKENDLIIRSGPFRWLIPIKAIHRVSPTRSPWSSPALSLNRLRIDYGDGKWIMVSPERRTEFVRSLGVTIS